MPASILFKESASSSPFHSTKGTALERCVFIVTIDRYHYAYHFNGMLITIDKAGRVVIPARLRRLAGLEAGTPLSASFENGAIKIVRDVSGPKIEARGQRRIARAVSKNAAPVDISAQVDEERSRWPL